MTIAETLIEKGKKEGKREGKIEGEAKGKIAGKWEEKIANTKNLLLRFPNLADETIAELLDCPLQKVKELRAQLSREENGKN